MVLVSEEIFEHGEMKLIFIKNVNFSDLIRLVTVLSGAYPPPPEALKINPQSEGGIYAGYVIFLSWGWLNEDE